MAGGRKKRRNRRKPVDPPTPPPPPPTEIKTKYVPPQPLQSYRDPNDSIEMSDFSSNESMANLSSDSTTPQYPTTGSLPALVNSVSSPFAGPSPDESPSHTQDNMETDDVETQLSVEAQSSQSTEDQHPSKRKRTNTNPEDSGRNPPTRQFTPFLSTPLNSRHDPPVNSPPLPPGPGQPGKNPPPPSPPLPPSRP